MQKYADAKLIDISVLTDDSVGLYFGMVIEHPSFEDLPEGSDRPIIVPWFEQQESTKMTSWDGYPKDETD